MPTYEYKCRGCGHTFEYFQSMSDRPLTTCLRCGGAVRRLIGAGSGIILRGSGGRTTGTCGASEARGAGLGASCDRARPCCGRETPCERSPRES